MKKYIIYARVGSPKQTRDSASISGQISSLEYYAKKNNLQVGKIISETASGADVKRKGIKELLEELSKDVYQGVLCTSFNKLSRAFSLSAKIWLLICEKNLEIITPYQTYKNDFESKQLMDAETNLAEAYRKHMSERIKRSLLVKKLRKMKG